MEFTIKSKFSEGDMVSLKSGDSVKVVHVEMNIEGKVLSIRYLVEFENLERRWVDEETLI